MAEKSWSARSRAVRLVRIVFGFTLLGIGVLMLVLPGPGWVAIVLALGILATEYVWARRLLDRIKSTAGRVKDEAARLRRKRPPPSADGGS